MALILWNSKYAINSGSASAIAPLPNELGFVTLGDGTVQAKAWLQRFDAAGQATSAQTEVPLFLYGNRAREIHLLASGAVVVTLEGGAGIQRYVGASLISADGASSRTVFIERFGIAGNVNGIDTTVFENDQFVVAWRDESSSFRFMRFDAAGVQLSQTTYAPGPNPAGALFPVIAALENGSVAAVWRATSGTIGVGGRTFDAGGTPIGVEFQIPVSVLPSEEPTILALENDTFVVGYVATADIPGDASGTGIAAHIVDSQGNLVGSPFRINTLTAGNQSSLQLESLEDGTFIAVWADYSAGNADIVARLFSSTGTALTPEIAVNGLEAGDQVPLRVERLSDGRIGVYWKEAGQFVTQILDPRDGIIRGAGQDDVLLGNTLLADNIIGFGGHDNLQGFGGNDVIYGLAGDDLILGGSDNDTLLGGDGVDHVFGGHGNDVLFGETGKDTLQGEAGNDVLYGGESDDVLLGGGDDDTLLGGNGDDQVWGGLGRDSLFGEAGADTLQGEAGRDILYGGDGLDVLLGGEGNDVLLGENDNDNLFGGADDDVLFGGSGVDVLQGEAGLDQLWGGLGNDVLLGGTEADTLLGGDGNDTLYGGSGNDVLFGEADVDELNGDDGSDYLHGGTGNDTLNGGAGDDFYLNGAEGDDRINGGTGNDGYLVGAAGLDTFVFNDNWGNDTIRDYTRADDQIDLSTVSGLNTFSQLQIYNITGGVQIYFAGNTITLLGEIASNMTFGEFIL
jgi:Ca2+-binding RTX toxin-like protein